MRALRLVVLLPLLTLGGCVVAPAPGYYAPPPRAYVAPRPYYYGYPHYGYGYGYGWRRW